MLRQNKYHIDDFITISSISHFVFGNSSLTLDKSKNCVLAILPMNCIKWTIYVRVSVSIGARRKLSRPQVWPYRGGVPEHVPQFQISAHPKAVAANQLAISIWVPRVRLYFLHFTVRSLTHNCHFHQSVSQSGQFIV